MYVFFFFLITISNLIGIYGISNANDWLYLNLLDSSSELYLYVDVLREARVYSWRTQINICEPVFCFIINPNVYIIY